MGSVGGGKAGCVAVTITRTLGKARRRICIRLIFGSEYRANTKFAFDVCLGGSRNFGEGCPVARNPPEGGHQIKEKLKSANTPPFNRRTQAGK